MKLEIHVIEPKPTACDPLAQRGHAALIWEADKELIQFDSDIIYDAKSQEDARDNLATHIALTVAAIVYAKAGGTGAGMENMAAYAQKLLAKQRGA